MLNCSNSYIHKLPTINPKIRTVLKLIAKTDSEFFELSDRIVCDIFDEIAFLNGREVKDLPEYWSIVRTFYELKRHSLK